MITQQQIEDGQLAERYLADQLTEAERTEFEQYYAEHPRVLRDLQAVAAIKLGLKSLRTSDELDKLRPQRRTGWLQTSLSLAACLLLAGAATTYLFRGAPTQQTRLGTATQALLDNRSAPLRVAASYDVARTRSTVDLVITKPTTADAIELRVSDLLAPPPARYRAELNTLDSGNAAQSLASVSELVLSSEGFLSVYLNSAVVAPGRYQLLIFDDVPEASTEPVTDFLFDVVADELH